MKSTKFPPVSGVLRWGGAVNIKIKEYPDRYMDVSYALESYNSNKLQMVAKRNLKVPGIVFGVGGGYTYADNEYTMESPYQEELEIKRNHDRFRKILAGGSLKATKWWFDEIELEPVFIKTDKQIQGIESDIRKAETNSTAYILANALNKKDFFLPGLEFDLTTGVAFTQINLIDTALYRYDWEGGRYPTPSVYGGELGNQYAANSDDRKFTVLSKLNLEYVINESHSVNFNSVFSLANGHPKDSLRELSLGRKSVFDSRMRSWVGGLNYDFRTKGDKFLNSFTVRYYIYSMDTKKSAIYGALDQVGSNWMPDPNSKQVDVVIVDINTDQATKVISETKSKLTFPTRPFLENMIFTVENNDIYIACVGGFGLDPRLQETGFVCIRSGETEFDESASWDMSQTAIEGTSYKAASLTNCKYIGDGKLCGFVAIAELVNDNPYTAKYSMPVLIDMRAKTVKKIEGIPLRRAQYLHRNL